MRFINDPNELRLGMIKLMLPGDTYNYQQANHPAVEKAVDGILAKATGYMEFGWEKGTPGRWVLYRLK